MIWITLLLPPIVVSLLSIQFPVFLSPFQVLPVSVFQKQILRSLGFSCGSALSRYHFLVTVICCSLTYHLRAPFFFFFLWFFWVEIWSRGKWWPLICFIWCQLRQADLGRRFQDALTSCLGLRCRLSTRHFNSHLGAVSICCFSFFRVFLYTWFPFPVGLSWSTWQLKVARKQVVTFKSQYSGLELAQYHLMLHSIKASWMARFKGREKLILYLIGGMAWAFKGGKNFGDYICRQSTTSVK